MVYKIVKYNMKGAVLFTKELLQGYTFKDEKFYDEENKIAFKTGLWSYTTNPNKGAYSCNERLLPYFADVTEDVPGYLKVNAETYNNCQLMTEKHGGYLQFWHEETKQVLRIAMNSHYYTPIN